MLTALPPPGPPVSQLPVGNPAPSRPRYAYEDAPVEAQRRRGRPRKIVPPPEDPADLREPRVPEPDPPAAPAEPQMDPAEAAAREQARKNLTAVKQQIHDLTMQLMTAEQKEVPELTQKLQRLRIGMLMLREIVEDVSDPNAHKELHLLRKMTDEANPEDDEEEQERMDDDERRHRLLSVGLNPESAGGMVRALQALEKVMEAPPKPLPDDDDSQSPDEPAAQ